MSKALEICRANEAKAKERLEDLKARHPWISQRAQELRDATGPLGRVEIRENGEKVYEFKSKSRLEAEERENGLAGKGFRQTKGPRTKGSRDQYRRAKEGETG